MGRTISAMLFLRTALQVIGLVTFTLGIACMPGPLVNPKAITSIFPALAAAGLVLKLGLLCMAAGVVLFAASFLIRRE